MKTIYNTTFKLPKKETEKSVKDLILTLFKNYKLDEKLFEQQIVNNWAAIVGKTIAKHTTSLYVSSKVIHLTVNSAALKAELLITKSQIIEKVNEYLKTKFVADITIR